MEGDSCVVEGIVGHKHEKGKLLFAVKFNDKKEDNLWYNEAELVKGSAVLLCNYLVFNKMMVSEEVKRKFWKQVKPETVPKDFFSDNFLARVQTARRICRETGNKRKRLSRKKGHSSGTSYNK